MSAYDKNSKFYNDENEKSNIYWISSEIIDKHREKNIGKWIWQEMNSVRRIEIVAGILIIIGVNVGVEKQEEGVNPYDKGG